MRLPEGAERYAAPQPDETAADAYAELDWVAEAGLPVERMARFRLRLGLPGLLATPDPATTPHFSQRAGYYLQVRGLGKPAVRLFGWLADARHGRGRRHAWLQACHLASPAAPASLPQHRSSDGSWRDLYYFRLDQFLAQDFALVR